MGILYCAYSVLVKSTTKSNIIRRMYGRNDDEFVIVAISIMLLVQNIFSLVRLFILYKYMTYTYSELLS